MEEDLILKGSYNFSKISTKKIFHIKEENHLLAKNKEVLLLCPFLIGKKEKKILGHVVWIKSNKNLHNITHLTIKTKDSLNLIYITELISLNHHPNNKPA